MYCTLVIPIKRSYAVPRSTRQNEPVLHRVWRCHSATCRETHNFLRSTHTFRMEIYYFSRSGYHTKIHQIVHLPQKVTVRLHSILLPPRKMVPSWLVTYSHKRSNTMRAASRVTSNIAEYCAWRLKLVLAKIGSHDWSLFFDSTNLLFYSAMFWLYHYFALLFFDSTIFSLFYSLTLLVFYSVMSFIYRKFFNY